MFDKVNAVEQRYNEISQMLMQPEVVSDQELYKKLMKEHKLLTPLIEKFHEYCSALEAEKDALEILSDKSSVTYAYYYSNIKEKDNVAAGKKGFICIVCGFIYEGETLPPDYICPICKHGAADFRPL